ncbi:SMP-30/gluconolactonase/LRE family protein [Myxococcaceae bacterium JPH2]|nr:SMP-30/gluconolactonase/LRE family protein [Myxococcaceae bacterium JPH2]
MRNKRLLGLGAGLLLVGGFVLKTLADAGQFKHLSPHFAGHCVPVAGMPGGEDITFHPTTGEAYVSSDDRRATQAGHPVPGGIYRFDPTGASPPTLLTGTFSADFHPHGLSLYVAPDGTQTLFVINHPSTGGAQVERFQVSAEGALVHTRTVRDPALVSPNDLVAVDAERFYVTNDHHFPPGSLQVVEDYLQLARGNVVYFDGKGFHEALTGMAFANGINCSADGKTVYLAQSVAQSLSVYTRDVDTGALHLRHTLPLGTGADNIERDATGALWIAAHPKLLDFASYAADVTETRRAPTQVLRLTPSGDTFQVEEVYLDDGSHISAAATAAVSGKQLLLGPVFAKNLLSCVLP